MLANSNPGAARASTFSNQERRSMSDHSRQDHFVTSMPNTLMEPTYTRLILQNVEVTARVGLASWERERPQRLLVNIELYAASRDYLREVTAASIIDYSPIYNRIQSWQSRPHTELIEALVSDLLSACFDCPQVLACKVSVTKPEVFDRCQGAGAEAFMRRRDYERGRDKPLPLRLEA
jgi:7,8-dihydroneopterin aldolase/epimerase/oxygenase